MSKAKKETRQVRVEPDVAEMADQIASLLGQSTPDFLTEYLRPLFREKLRKELDRRAKELREPKG